LMKKVTIITPTEYESLVLEALGRSRVTQLKEVTGPGFEELKDSKGVDYQELYEKVHSRYLELMELGAFTIEHKMPTLEELRRLAEVPEDEVNAVLEELERLIAQLKEVREAQSVETKKIADELQAAIEEQNAAYEEARKGLEEKRLKLEQEGKQLAEDLEKRYVTVKARLEAVRALQADELKSCLAVGIVKNEFIARLEEYLKRYPDLSHKVVSISPEESILFINGSEESRRWVGALMLVFEVKDISEVLDTREGLLDLDAEKLKEVLERYQGELKQIEEELKRADQGKAFESKLSELEEKIRRLDETHKQNIEKLKQQYDARLKQLEAKHAQEIEALKREQTEALSKVAYMDYLLRILSDKRAPVLRTKVVSVLQGWIPEKKIPVLEKAMGEVESKTGERLFLQFENPGHEDHNIPTPEPEFKPSFLQPAWKLTTLRGWPSVHEVNPNYITILIFCFQFGLMYGDVGQGAIFLLLGFFLARRYKKGMMSKLGVLFIPMGISAIFFGVLYDSVFLIEGMLTHHHPILPNPVEHTTKLMLLVFQIAVVEVVAGLVLGAINEYREGHKWGIIGEHGLGMILYVVGLYLSAMYFIKTGDFMAVLSHWTFIVMVSGMVLAMLEPIISAVAQHNFGIEVFGEGVGALLMTFVEGLANLFSFLRIAAFALAHASLAIAAHSMAHFMGVGGLLLMNIIAMSFEFISSSVQSLRLLYYEFMGKFFQGDGTPFRPFKIRNIRRRVI